MFEKFQSRDRFTPEFWAADDLLAEQRLFLPEGLFRPVMRPDHPPILLALDGLRRLGVPPTALSIYEVVNDRRQDDEKLPVASIHGLMRGLRRSGAARTAGIVENHQTGLRRVTFELTEVGQEMVSILKS